MKKILALLLVLLMSMMMFTACGGGDEAAEGGQDAQVENSSEEGEAEVAIASEDIVGKWIKSDEAIDGESDFNIEEEDPAWIEYYIFNEDGTGVNWLGDEGVTSTEEFIWEIEGNVVKRIFEPTGDVDAELLYEDGMLKLDMGDYVPGLINTYSKME